MRTYKGLKSGYYQIRHRSAALRKTDHMDNLDYEIAYLHFDGKWSLRRVSDSRYTNPDMFEFFERLSFEEVETE